MNPAGSMRRNILPILTAASVFALIVVRACVQSITIDEADTYIGYVATAEASHWLPFANNHVLNSMLMRLFVTVFGPSELTLRIPALIGALLYVVACYQICRLLTERVGLRVVLFLCLTCNPFVLDYLVAARGYSLALGLLTAAIAVAMEAGLQETISEARLRRVCGTSALLLALSAAANFSFAIVGAATMAAIYAWLYGRSGGSIKDWRRAGVLATWCAIPALLVFVFLAAPLVLNWPKEQFVYGAKSVAQMYSSILLASTYRVNPQIVNPLLHPVIDGLKVLLVPVVAAAFAVQAFAIAVAWRRLNRPARLRAEVGVGIFGVVLVTFLAHWTAFRAFGLLLPENRTGLYFAMLLTLDACIAAAVCAPSRLSAIARKAVAGALIVLACYFLSCLRIDHFQQWPWNADNKQLYRAVAMYARKVGARDIESHWKWVSSLNYYRIASGEDAFNEVAGPPAYSKDRKLYVLDLGDDQEFLNEQKLRVVYRDSLDAMIAVREESPDMTANPQHTARVAARIRNLSRPGASDFRVGERFQVTVEGPPRESVYVSVRRDSRPATAERLGQTDQHGRFTLRAEMGDDHVGEWTEVWSVGTSSAPPIEFTVKPRIASR